MQNLDSRRLGKQRVEAIQIARNLLNISKGAGWKNHPAVLMWKGYEPFLVVEYLKLCLSEWESRGYKNIKTLVHFAELSEAVAGREVVRPHWITPEFIEAHRSNLIRKDRDFYKRLFPDTQEGLPYVWGDLGVLD